MRSSVALDRRFQAGALSLAVLLVLASPGCGGDDSTSATTTTTTSGAGGESGEGGDGGGSCTVDTTYDPTIAPASFVADVDNPLYPLVPGTKFVYENGDETVEVTVTANKKTILGVSCTEVHDVASVAGEVIEDTLDWFAQDQDGAVWYFGEDTKEMSGGMVTSTHGSWEAGVDGAKPGIVVPAAPKVGDTYRQEYYACEAEDMGEVLALDATAMVKAGSYTGCLKTHDFTPLEPDINEEKYYCPGVGLVLSVDVVTGEREELASVTP